MTMVESDTKTKKTAVAKHLLLDAAGQVVEEFEQAHGIRYINIESGATFDFIPTNPDSQRMLSVFGARTLATNEASAARQKDGTAADEMDAIADRFALIQPSDPAVDPVWVDRTREGGPRVDTVVLSQAMVQFYVDEKIIPDAAAERDAAAAKVLAKFDDPKDGKAQISKARSNPKVETLYKSLKGGKAATSQDLAGMLA